MVIQSLLKHGNKDAALYNKEGAAKAGLDGIAMKFSLLSCKAVKLRSNHLSSLY